MQLTKEQWIQKAKALFFDCIFCVDAGGIRKEINEIIEEGGGYDYRVESSETPLRWPDKAPENCGHCQHPLTVTEKGDHWCPGCHWTDDDGKETS